MHAHRDFIAAFDASLKGATLPPGVTACAPDEAERRFAVYRNNVTVLGVFSEAEAEVLLYLSQGHSNKEIARLIGMSPDTVKYRLKSVFRKIGVSKRRDAVRISAERGLIPNGVGSAATAGL